MEAKYVRVAPPMPDRVTELVKAMKGPGRTMAQFAKACGLSPSTLSRLINSSPDKPATQNLLTRLFEKRDPSCTITFDELMRANGMAPQRAESDYEAEMQRRRAVGQARLRRFDVMRDGIKNGLLERGIQIGLNRPHHLRIRFDADEEITVEDALVFGLVRSSVPHLILRVADNNNAFFWGFSFITMRMEEEEVDPKDTTSYVLDYAWRVIERRIAFFLRSAFQWDIDGYIRNHASMPENERSDIERLDKMSFVFVDARLHDVFCTIVQSFDLKENTSAILLDGDTGEFVQERFLTTAGSNDATDLFRLSPVANEQDCGQDVPDENTRMAQERIRRMDLFDDL